MEIRLDTTLERYIDLLIMEEFISEPEFARMLLSAANILGDYTILTAIHSKTDADLGESDIVFIVNIDGNRHSLHIEDKIDAGAMPNQHDRYHLRAQKDIAAGLYDTYSVLLIAPKKYIAENKEAQKYANKLTYEQMRQHFSQNSDSRAKYKLALIDRAITVQKSGYQYEANPAMVCFCNEMIAHQKKYYPGLPLGTVAWWPEYPTLLKDTKVVLKADRGFCDLQFGHTLAEDLYPRVKDHLSDRMHVVPAGKSASVRIMVTPLPFDARFSDYQSAVNETFAALTELYNLSNKLLIT